MDNRIAVFEEINQNNISLLKNHLKKGEIVYYKNIHGKVKKEIENIVGKEKIIRLSDIVLEYKIYINSWKQAHEDLDNIFEREFSKSRAIENMAKLMEYPEIKNMYKKKLLDELTKNYELLFIANELVGRDKVPEVIVYPRGKFYAINKFNDKIKVILNSGIKNKINGILRKPAYLLYPLYIFLKKINLFPKKTGKKEYVLGIGIDQPTNIFERKYYGSSVIIDEKEFPKENILFIDEHRSRKHLEEYGKNGLDYTSLLNDREPVSFRLFKKILFELVPAWFKTLFSLGEGNLIVRTSAKIMSDYILWNITLDNYKIKNYMRRMVPDPISKTAILRKNGTKTWFHYPNNTAVDNIDWDEKTPIRTDISFIDYDYAIVNGEKVKRFMQAHRNFVKEYKKNGTVSAQLIKEIEEGKLESDLEEWLKKKNINKNSKIISVFGTAHGNGVPLGLNSGVIFAQDLLNLLDDFKDIAMIVKIKYTMDRYEPELREAYSKLIEHERVLFFPTKEEYRSSACEIIAKSDLVIGAAYGSPPTEALSAGKKVLYYDPDGKEGCYNKIPKLVAHDYEELKKLVRYWMYVASDGYFESFLDRYVKKELDEYMDGKALARLREMLKNE